MPLRGPPWSRNLILMNRPAPAKPLPDVPENDPPVTREELEIIGERMKTYEQDRKASSPADEVMERLLRRHPAP